MTQGSGVIGAGVLIPTSLWLLDLGQLCVSSDPVCLENENSNGVDLLGLLWGSK